MEHRLLLQYQRHLNKLLKLSGTHLLSIHNLCNSINDHCAKQYRHPPSSPCPFAEYCSASSISAPSPSAPIGVAWVPSSLARDQLADKRLLILEKVLPAVCIDICAMRLKKDSGAAVEHIWDWLTANQLPIDDQ